MQPRHSFSELAEAVADGRSPDWASIDLSAFDEESRELVAELRALDGISRQMSALTLNWSTGSIDLGAPATAGARRSHPVEWGALEIREHVGRGRFGDVYRAWDPAIDRDVALKLLRKGTSEPASDTAVVQEARLMGRVRHPNVVTIYGAAHHGGRTGLWMEFVKGRTLETELRERGQFNADEAARIGIELCRALGAVHAAGLVHRDVKAQNVLREITGRVVLGDFGTGLELDEEEGAVGTLAGTPVYLAPELFDLAPATPRSDLYSLGVLLFHLVTGTFPVRGRSIGEIRRAHASGRRERLDTLRADLPAAFATVVGRALAPAPPDRFATASEMEMALAAVVTPSPETNAEAAPAQVGPGRVLTGRWLMALGVVVAVGTLWALATDGFLSRAFAPPRSNGAAAAGTPQREGRRLSRVAAPTEAQFWGQPSPDGHTYSFVDMDGDVGVFDPISGDQRILTTRTLTGGWAYHTSTFSPDGQQIAYGWQNDDEVRELRVIAAAGGDPRAIWRSADEAALPIDWSRGRDVILCLFERADGRRELGVITASGSAVTRLTTVTAGHSTARLSPDARHVVFDDLQQPDTTNRDIFAIDLDRPGERRTIVASDSDDFGPLWRGDGNALLFVSTRTGEPSIWSIGVEGSAATGEPLIRHRNIGRIAPNGLSAGGTLFYTLQVGLVDVYQASFDSTRSPVIESARPIAPAQVGSKITSGWSPDGRFVAYVALPHAGTGAADSRRLAILDVESGTSRLLQPRLTYYQFPRWSPDGRQLLVKGTDLASRRGVHLIDPVTGDTRPAALVTAMAPQEIGSVHWGPDSNTILLARQKLGVLSLDLASGVERLLFSYQAEGITTVTPMPGLGLSRDGRTLAYSAYRKNAAGQDERVLRVMPLGRPGRDLLVGNFRFQDWTADGHVLLTDTGGDSQSASLLSIDPAGGAPRSLGFSMHGLRDVRVNADGRRIVFTTGFPGSELWALDNFLPANGQ